MSENLPSAKEMYENHRVQADSVESLGKLAAGQVGVESYYGDIISLDKSVRPHLEQAVKMAQEDLHARDKEAGAVVSANQDIYEAEARADMEDAAKDNYRFYANSRALNERRFRDEKARGLDGLAKDSWRNLANDENLANKAASILGPDKLAEMARDDMKEDVLARHQQHVDSVKRSVDALPSTRNFYGEDTPRTEAEVEIIKQREAQAKELADKHQDILEAQARVDMANATSGNEQKAA